MKRTYPRLRPSAHTFDVAGKPCQGCWRAIVRGSTNLHHAEQMAARKNAAKQWPETVQFLRRSLAHALIEARRCARGEWSMKSHERS